MQPWKPMLLIVPAGLLIGTLVGHTTRPVPLAKEERSWPASVRERAGAIEPWRALHQGGPQDLGPASHRYRPDLDYEVFAWPDQTDHAAELLGEDYAYRAPPPAPEPRFIAVAAPELPLTRRAEAELAAEREPVPPAGTAEAREATEKTPSEEGAIIVLPPVPPPLAASSAGMAETRDVHP